MWARSLKRLVCPHIWLTAHFCLKPKQRKSAWSICWKPLLCAEMTNEILTDSLKVFTGGTFIMPDVNGYACQLSTRDQITRRDVFIISAKEVIFWVRFVCLPVRRTAKKPPYRIPWNFLAGIRYISKQIHKISLAFANVARYDICPWPSSALNDDIHF